MFKRYAYYESHSTGWCLVVYHDEKPGKSINGQGPERVGPYEVPQEMIDMDGSPNLGMIAKAFPAPSPEVYNDPSVILNQEEEGLHLDPALYDKTVYYKELLPEWAAGMASEGVFSPMQQLFTKNGRLHGNATYVGHTPSAHVKGETIHTVVTDANNWIRYTTKELLDVFEPGPFILKTFPNPLSKEDWDVSQRQTEG